jgi:hypothetical protein
VVAEESGEVGNPASLGMTKKERVVVRSGPLPTDRVVVEGETH